MRPPVPQDRRPLWLLALLVASYLLGQLHQASERHVVCATHGELTHESAHGHDVPDVHRQPQGATAGDDVGEELAAGGAAGEGHHHCPLSSFHREDLATFQDACARPGASPSAVGTRGRARHEAADARRFLLAPKQSPPA